MQLMEKKQQDIDQRRLDTVDQDGETDQVVDFYNQDKGKPKKKKRKNSKEK